MNKFTIAVALVAVFVGMVAATKLPHHHHNHHKSLHSGGEEDFGGELETEGHRPFHAGGGHKHFDSEGEFVHRRPHHLRKAGLTHGRRGRINGAGAGAIGAAGIRHEGEFDAGVHSGNRLGSHKSIEGQKGFLAGSKKDFQAGKNHHDLNDNEAHNRHSVVNKNKLIVKESDTGFNDDVGFRNRNEHSDSAHIGGSEGKFIGGKAGGKIVSDKEFDSERDANIHADSETEGRAEGAIGLGHAEFN